MSFNEVLQELPGLTVGQRQVIIRRALELDEPLFAPQDEALVEDRLAKHRQDPTTAISLDEMKARLRRSHK